ncbi:hypothetical protein FHS18_005465 [Paenibacillus phyllosphaerae]|uniref:DUF1868 domain-containing protein n=1 Tax=Paenibacillus phyllosphaerae TaxID=274593 RepID=A0A7W5FQJ5_9BACL|nr:hypothetical protein [Paenibacillus phyllosphaerae]MBB3113353.1 hypothetical protein [Paenibacillus phyllosphaerae]
MNDLTHVTSDYETYVSFLEQKRIRDMSQRPEEWVISNSLPKKITKDGQMNHFRGSTSVIRLSLPDREACQAAQTRLLRELGSRLVPLLPETFHLTIHCFSNENNTPGGVQAVLADVDKREGEIAAAFRLIAEQYGGQSIRMRSLGASTNGKDVASVKYAPASERDYTILMDLYNRMNKLFPENGDYVPHVSLAYFKLEKLSKEEIDNLYATLEQIHEELPLDIELDIDRFVYQHHEHMNDFRDIFSIRELR